MYSKLLTTYVRVMDFMCLAVVFDFSVSGYISLDMVNAAGAAMIEADNKYSESTPKEINAPITEPTQLMATL